MTLGVAGALVVVLGAGFGTGGRNNLLGLLYAFLSVAGYAVYLMISGAVAQKYRAATINEVALSLYVAHAPAVRL